VALLNKKRRKRIKIKRVYEKPEKEDGFHILVDRLGQEALKRRSKN